MKTIDSEKLVFKYKHFFKENCRTHASDCKYYVVGFEVIHFKELQGGSREMKRHDSLFLVQSVNLVRKLRQISISHFVVLKNHTSASKLKKKIVDYFPPSHTS